MQNKEEEYFRKIVETFGENILSANKELDREKLAKIIFSNKEEKEKLDKLTAKYVVPKIEKDAKEISKEMSVVIDAALLFEMGLDKICDMTIGVIASNKKCIDRICIRDKIDKDLAKLRLESQKSIEFFKRNCNYCITNEEDTIPKLQIEEIFNREEFI